MKTLEEIALQVAEGMPDGFLWTEGCGWEAGIIQSEVIDFARRLVAALGAQEPVGFVYEKTLSAILKSKEACIRDTQIQNGSPLYAAPVVNPDWQMVPKEPTPEMVEAGRWEDGVNTARKVWQYMLAAAPEYGK